ncbi:hypothetical protein K3148_09785 [Qipengyuania aurantiaca]|uniref:DUF3617 family protein n=1 Tax=Qipengyuania aurantiaca TaxID=2867233 RepID=A0ABX8ZJC9_9SPHN|nr:hypothetical protein [Qipengyuania aurantiaca]QZD89126.1 hypothetical protein K3148_09785 [Qipengyuania aurantiaca]
MKTRIALSLTCLAALGACDAVSGPKYEISMEMRDLAGPWLSDEEKRAMEAEFLAEWAGGPQCVGAQTFGDWKSIVEEVSAMGADKGCESEITQQDETGFTRVMRCTGKGEGDFVSDGSQLVATTTAYVDGDNFRFETRFDFGHEEIPGSFAYTLAGTGRRVETCST